MLHLVGWAQNFDIDNFKIDEDLTISESGVYFQQVHPLITLHNIKSIAPDFKNMQFAEYKTDVRYTKGAIVNSSEQLYKLVADTNVSGEQHIRPGDNPEVWVPYDPFSDWLRNKTMTSVLKAVSTFCTEKLASSTAKTLCENKILFNGTGRLADTIDNKSRLVGFEIVPIRSRGISLKINKIGLQFTKTGEYKLYLFHSSSSEPIRNLSFEVTKPNSMNWFACDDLVLPYISDETDAGGSWYLVYKQSELPEGSKAIRKDRDWSKAPCRTCSQTDYISYQAWSRYLEVHPFYVSEDEPGVKENTLWDIEHNVYTYDSNYGINLEVTVACDITDFIIEQKAIFTDVIAKQLAVDMMREFLYNANVRTNRNSINASKMDIVYELDGDTGSMKQSGLSYQLSKAYKALKLSTAGIDRVCLPCKNNGIRYLTV